MHKYKCDTQQFLKIYILTHLIADVCRKNQNLSSEIVWKKNEKNREI